LNIPKVSHHSNSRLASQKKQEEREEWYKIVVKILRWKDNYYEKIGFEFNNKISIAEWQQYCKHMVEICVTKGASHTVNELKELESLIKKHGGFQ
jgi:hypothetical protein